MSIFKSGKTFNFHDILFLRCLNYPNQLYVTKNLSGNMKNLYSNMKISVFRETKNMRDIQNSKVKFDNNLY